MLGELIKMANSVAGLLGIVFAAVVAWILMKARQVFATKEEVGTLAEKLSMLATQMATLATTKEVDELADKVSVITMQLTRLEMRQETSERRLDTAETGLQKLPEAMHSLALSIEGLRGDFKAFHADLTHLGEVVGLLDKRIDRHEEILSEAARRRLNEGGY